MEEIKTYPYKGYWIRILFDYDEHGPIWEISDKEDQSEWLHRCRADKTSLCELIETFKEIKNG